MTNSILNPIVLYLFTFSHAGWPDPPGSKDVHRLFDVRNLTFTGLPSMEPSTIHLEGSVCPVILHEDGIIWLLVKGWHLNMWLKCISSLIDSTIPDLGRNYSLLNLVVNIIKQEYEIIESSATYTDRSCTTSKFKSVWSKTLRWTTGAL